MLTPKTDGPAVCVPDAAIQNHPTLDRTAQVLHLLLGAALFSIYVDLFFLVGNFKASFYLSLLLFLLVQSWQRWKPLPTEQRALPWRQSWPVLLALVALTAGSFLPLEEMTRYKIYLRHLLFAPVIFVMLHWWLLTSTSNIRQILQWLLYAAAVGVVLINFVEPIQGEFTTGIYTNQHYLALYLSWALLPLLLMSFQQSPLWLRTVSILCIGATLYLLVMTGSRPIWVATLLSTPFAVYVLHGRGVVRRSLIVTCLVVTVLGLLFPLQFAQRFADFLVNISADERLPIWQDSWTMLAHNNWLDWTIGHGIGGFKILFHNYNTFQEYYVFPHSFLLELVFDCGIIGIISAAFIAWRLALLAIAVVKSCKNTPSPDDPDNRFPAFLAINILLIHCIFCYFTVSIFSKYFLLLIPVIPAYLAYLTAETRA